MGDFRARATRRSPPSSTNDGSCESKKPSSLGNLVTESKSTEWTDEKHSLYLKSMEASFVNQLYDSSELLGFCRLSDPTNSRKKHFTARSPSGQFKVLRGGSWQKIHFERAPDLQLMKAEGSRGLLKNPWIRHFRHACTPQVGASADVHNDAACASEALDLTGNHSIPCGSEACNLEQIDACQTHLCHHDLVGSDTEVSDQNFVDEEVEGERESQMCDAKTTKSCTTDASCTDQVVPHDKLPAREDVTENCIPATG